MGERFLFIFLSSKDGWRNNISNQILESFQEQKCQENYCRHSSLCISIRITNNGYKIHLNWLHTTLLDKTSLPLCFFSLHPGSSSKLPPPPSPQTEAFTQEDRALSQQMCPTELGHPCLDISTLLQPQSSILGAVCALPQFPLFSLLFLPSFLFSSLLRQ